MKRTPNPHVKTIRLRDYFTARAMQGIWSAKSCPSIMALNYDEVANATYRQADAMLKRRTKKQD